MSNLFYVRYVSLQSRDSESLQYISMQLGNFIWMDVIKVNRCDFLKKLIFNLKNSSSGPEPIGYCPSTSLGTDLENLETSWNLKKHLENLENIWNFMKAYCFIFFLILKLSVLNFYTQKNVIHYIKTCNF